MENWKDLSDEEKARLNARTPIAIDDANAACTKVGWEKEMKKKAASVVEPDVPNGVIYCAAKKDDQTKTIFVEAERAFDAKALACFIFGVPEVYISCLAGTPPRKPVPRWQTKFIGYASNDTLRRVARLVHNEKSNVPWRELHELQIER